MASSTPFAARTAGGGAWRVVDAANPELAPDGSSLLFVKDGQIYRTRVTRGPLTAMDRGERPFIKEWGTQSAPKWSPDGRKIAFVSTRTDHSFIVVYDVASRTVKYMAPSVDFDTMPLWLPDSRHLIFVRRPGLPFGQQGQQEAAGSVCRTVLHFSRLRPPPAGPDARAAAARPHKWLRQPVSRNRPSITSGPDERGVQGRYTLGVWKADVTTGEAQEIWHNQPNDRLDTTLANARLAGDYLVFPLVIGTAGGRGRGGSATGKARQRRPRPSTSGIAITRSTSRARAAGRCC
jgi:dipeptidyl aminopeptidase/acylaminoacyl peptidase